MPSPDQRNVSLAAVRRLAVTQQGLAGKRRSRGTAESIVSAVRDLGYVQWDPVTTVAPSHLLTLWSRLGSFRPADLDRLLWEERRLFEHWTPQASIVLTEDYPLYASLMQRYPESLSHSWANHRTKAKQFLAAHRTLRQRMLRELAAGPLRLDQFQDHRRTKRSDGDWSPQSDVAQMLFHLSMSGEVMVVGHEGNRNLWGTTEGFLPPGTEREPLSEEEFERQAAQRAIRALGTATPTEITYYFVRGRYEHLPEVLADLEADGRIHRVRVDELGPRDERYVHDADRHALEAMESGDWEPRLSLLPPFDNFVCSTARTQRLFGFEYVREQFLPKEKRRFGTYVLPILAGDRLIGRIDPHLDKKTDTLVVQAVHAEPDAPREPSVGTEIRETIAGLAEFVGASRVRYPSRVPAPWRSALR
jgi:uncharacterized protein